MNIEINTDEIVKEIKEEIKDGVEAWIDGMVEKRVSEEVMAALNKQLDHIEKTPYNIIHHRVYAMLDKYIEQEVKNRIWEQECNGKGRKSE